MLHFEQEPGKKSHSKDSFFCGDNKSGYVPNMGSTLSKEIGKEAIDQQQETVGGFHVIEVINNNLGERMKIVLRGLK